MSTLEIVLIIGLIPFTAFNLYYLTLGKKKKRAAAQAYRQTFAELESKARLEMEKHRLEFEEKQAFLNDAGQGILLCFSRDGRQMAVTLKESFHLLPLAEIHECALRYDEAGGKYLNIRAEIRAKNQLIPFVFGTRPWRPKSILGKMVMENAMEFCNLINARCRPTGSAPSGNTKPFGVSPVH